MKLHFIAIGGSAMHNLALALHAYGDEITGSDDEIFEPSRTRLEKAGLLPAAMGWKAENIHTGLDAVILGMHARKDNPELIRAQELGLKVYSYPEFIYGKTAGKRRVVIGGSHGKTTITSMVMHAMSTAGMDFDYLVGAQLEGFDLMVRLSNAPVIIIEGDEYLSSPIDLRPKFHWYRPHLALLSGIAWDHVNVFPTFDQYLEQFRIFSTLIEDGGTLVYNAEDEYLVLLAKEQQGRLQQKPYRTPSYGIDGGVAFVDNGTARIALQVFGRHNLQNLMGALQVCLELGMDEEAFFSAMQHFKGASKRLEKIAAKDDAVVIKDFAHAPSKLKAAVTAVKEQYAQWPLTAVMELHTFSSLNKTFLSQYVNSMDQADEAIVYFNPATLQHKRLPGITEADVKTAFGRDDLRVFTDSGVLTDYLGSRIWTNASLLWMTSGNFDGVDINRFSEALLGLE